MDTSPRILVWNYSDEELRSFELFLGEMGGPKVERIGKRQGHLLVRDILFTDKVSDEEFDSDEKVALFYNVQADIVQKVVSSIRSRRDLVRPIFAVVTQHSIDWRFSHLVGELIKERNYFRMHKAPPVDEDH